MIYKIIGSLLVLFMLIFLVSCDTKTNKGADGYTFGTPQYEKQRVTIDVVTYKTRTEFNKALKNYSDIPKDANYEVQAFSELRPSTNFDNCTIHMMEPSTDYQPEFIGHEFVHCVYGQWHTNNKSTN